MNKYIVYFTELIPTKTGRGHHSKTSNKVIFADSKTEAADQVYSEIPGSKVTRVSELSQPKEDNMFPIKQEEVSSKQLPKSMRSDKIMDNYKQGRIDELREVAKWFTTGEDVEAKVHQRLQKLV